MSFSKRPLILFLALMVICPWLSLSQDTITPQIKQHLKESAARRARLSDAEKRVENSILRLVELAETADTSTEKAAKLKTLITGDPNYMVDSKDRIRVSIGLISASDSSAIISKVRSVGGTVLDAGTASIICQIHPKQLRKIIGLPGVRRISYVARGYTNFYTSQGDRQLHADDARNSFSVFGWGAQVGVIGDGITNINAVQQAQELLEVVNCYPDRSYLGDGTEGTRMLEVVHDLAPFAQLYFYPATLYPKKFGEAVRALRSAGCTIIVDDLYYPNEPFYTDEDDEIGAPIREFIAGGGTLISSAGNDNKNGDGESAGHRYSGETANTNGLGYLIFPDGNTYIAWTVPSGQLPNPPGGAVMAGALFLQWSTSWADPSSDYNLEVWNEDETEKIGEGGEDDQGPSPPIERVTGVVNNTPGSQTYHIKILHRAGSSASVHFTIFLDRFGMTYGGVISHETSDNKYVRGHAAYPGVIAVGAYLSADMNQIASFSAMGKSWMYSTASGQWNYQETPLITATSEVETYTGYPFPFGGTSAAAPHIAGIAALYFSLYPTRTREDFISDLTQSAATIGTYSGGTYYAEAGYGRADALACLTRADTRTTTPVIHPLPEGKYTSSFWAWIEKAPGTTVYYKTDGGDPLDGRGLLYNEDEQIEVSQSATLTAAATMPGKEPSTTRAAHYEFVEIPMTRVEIQKEIQNGMYETWPGNFYLGGSGSWVGWPSGQVFSSASSWLIMAPQGWLGGATDQKFRGWTHDGVLTQFQNYGTVPSLNTGSHTIIGRFNKVLNATVQAKVLEGEALGGPIDFADPWLVDSQGSFSGYHHNQPNNPTINSVPYSVNNVGANSQFMGVHKNQSGPPDWSNPCYSIAAPAPSSVDIGGVHASMFLEWACNGAEVQNSTLSSTKVKFTADGATATALYKGHLLSSIDTATICNSQRKVAVCGTNSYAVYASGGLIWFTKNAGVGGWSDEVLISSISNRFAKNPSITAFINPPLSTTPKVIVAWEDQTSEADPIHRVHYRVSTDNGATWQAITDIDAAAEEEEATPVVDGCSSDAGAVGVLVSVANVIPDRCLNVQVIPGDPLWYQPAPETEGTMSQSPSLARSSQGNWHLVYEKSGQILYQEFTVANNAPSFIGSPSVISGSYSGCAKPSVAVSATGTIVTVAWEASGSGGVRIVTCQRNSGSWSTPVEISHGTHAGHSPSIAIDDNAQTQTVAFKCDTHIGLATKPLTTGSWSAVQDLGQGNAPSLCDNNLASPLLAFTQGTSAPYSVRLGSYQQYVQTLAEENKSLYSAAGNDNSGRHLALAGGKFHELFLSGGEVFYRRRDQASGAWENTLRISNGAGGATLDALCRLTDGSLHAVWEESIGGTRFRIKYSSSSDGNLWSAPYVLESDDTVSTSQWSTYPVIGSAAGNRLVVVHAYNGGLRYKVSTNGGVTWPDTWTPISGVTYPSSVSYLSATTIGTTLWLSYDYRTQGVFQRSFDGTNWSAQAAVSSGTGTVQGRVSSIACDMSVTQPMVAFSAQTSTEAEYRTVIRYGNPPGWFEQLPRVAAGVSDYYPSLTSSYYVAALGWHPTVASYTSDNRIRLWAVNSEGWYSRFLATGSAYAALAENREPVSYDAIVQYTSQQSSPYTVGLWAGSTLSKAEGDSLHLVHHRRLVLGDSSWGGSGTLFYEVAAPRMLLASGDEVTVSLKRHAPSAVLSESVDTLMSYLESEDVEVPANARSLRWTLSVSMQPGSDSVESSKAASRTLADRSCLIQLADSRGTRLASAPLTGADGKTGLLIDLSTLQGKKVHLALKDLAPLKKGSVVLGIGDDITKKEPPTFVSYLSSGKRSVTQLKRRFPCYTRVLISTKIIVSS